MRFAWGVLVGACAFALVGCGGISTRGTYQRAAGAPDPIFSENLGSGFVGSVDVIALQSDGKILAGGRVTSFNGRSCGSLIRLNSDGTEDTSFAIGAGFDDSVSAVFLQSDGKILVGGGFATYQGVAAPFLIRLNADGSVDADFSTAMGSGFDGGVNAIVQSAAGDIFVGGSFSNFNGNSRLGLVKLSSTGVEDGGFATAIGGGFDLPINALVLRESTTPTSLCAGGSFTNFDGHSANRVLCLSEAGAYDTDFLTGLGTGFNNSVRALLTGGSVSEGLLAGGYFDSFQGTALAYFSLLQSDGSLDSGSAFNQDFSLNSEVTALSWDTEGNLLVGGSFTSAVSGESTFSAGGIFRLVDGELDTTFSTTVAEGFDASVQSLAAQSDGKILVGGEFTKFLSQDAHRFLRLQ